LLNPTVSVIDKAVNKGLIHRNTAARYKSRLTRHVAEVA
jgi:ribosomal protein S20